MRELTLPPPLAVVTTCQYTGTVTVPPLSFIDDVCRSIRSSVSAGVASTAHRPVRDDIEGGGGILAFPCALAGTSLVHANPPIRAAAATPFMIREIFIRSNSVANFTPFRVREETPGNVFQ